MLSVVEKALQMVLLRQKDFQLSLKKVNIHEIIEQAKPKHNVPNQSTRWRLYKELNATSSQCYGQTNP